MKSSLKISFLILSLFLTACSSFLYYPSRQKFVNPDKLRFVPEEVVFSEKTDPKNRLTAWYFSSGKNPKGIFVVFHGNAQNVSTHFSTMYWALDKGYDMFIFDYPGYGGSAGEPTPLNTVLAGHEAITYAQKRWPKTPLIVMGQSLGGAVALRTMIDIQDRRGICAVVIDSGLASFKSAGRMALSKTWITWPLQWLPFLVLSDKYAPKRRIKEISPLPLLVMHRKDDPIVSYKLGERIFEEAAEPKKWVLLQGEGHVNTFTDTDRVENQKILFDFLSQTKCILY